MTEGNFKFPRVFIVIISVRFSYGILSQFHCLPTLFHPHPVILFSLSSSSTLQMVWCVVSLGGPTELFLETTSTTGVTRAMLVYPSCEICI